MDPSLLKTPNKSRVIPRYIHREKDQERPLNRTDAKFERRKLILQNNNNKNSHENLNLCVTQFILIEETLNESRKKNTPDDDGDLFETNWCKS